MTDASAGLSLYVHVPFCRAVCPYCAFRVLPLKSHDDERVLLAGRAIADEIDVWRASGRFEGRGPVRSVYLGGGTPSLLPAGTIADLLFGIDRAWGIGPDTEVTLEVEPGAYHEGELRLLVDAGVTRFSVGVQSLDDGELAALGRGHGDLAVEVPIPLAVGAHGSSLARPHADEQPAPVR